MTYDEACTTVAMAAGAMSPAEWSDFFSMPAAQQEATAALYRDAVFAAQGPGGWETLISVLGTAAAVFGAASGIGTAYTTLRGLL